MTEGGCGKSMVRKLGALLISGVFVGIAGSATAHHSFAMFDQENPIEIVGVVQEFKYTNPHTFLILQVKEPGGATTTWSLEGPSPSALVREDWSSKSLRPRDELKLTISPLRGGAPGGAWTPNMIKFLDGRPPAITP
jgi:hypothetical protein